MERPHIIPCRLLLLLACCISFPAAIAANQAHDGFQYGKYSQPDGREWENPGRLGLNKEPARATFHSFGSVEAARRVLPEHSAYYQLLDGQWKFHWAPDPESRPTDFYRWDYDDTGWDEIEVPSNWNVSGIMTDGSQRYGKPI